MAISKKVFEEYKAKIHEKLEKKDFKQYDWDIAIEGEVVYYKKMKKKLVIVLCSNELDYYSDPINIVVDNMTYFLEGSIEDYVSNKLSDMSPSISTSNLDLFFALCDYDFDFNL